MGMMLQNNKMLFYLLRAVKHEWMNDDYSVSVSMRIHYIGNDCDSSEHCGDAGNIEY